MKVSLAKVNDTKTKLKQMVAYLDSVDVADSIEWSDILDAISDQYYWVQSDIQNLYDMFWNHLQGHLPPINSATQMQTALDALGLSGDYQVQKQTVYASDTGKPVEDSITFKFKR